MGTAAVALAQLLQTCAPDVGARTMTAIVRVESGGNYLAIRDNDVDRTFSPVDAREAVAWSTQLLRLHHSIDFGVAQINSANLSRLGMSVADAFDPCLNVHGGATILSYDYGLASSHFGPGQFALRRAIGAYNTGSIFAGEDYVNRILVAAGIRSDADVHVPDVRSIGGDGASLAAGSPIRPLPLALTKPRKKRLVIGVRESGVPSAAAAQAISARQAPILVPVGVSAGDPAPVVAPIAPQPAAAAAIAPVAVAPIAADAKPSASARPGLTISSPFGSPIVLNLLPAVAPVLVHPVGALPYVSTRPTVLVDMTVIPSPSPSPSKSP